MTIQPLNHTAVQGMTPLNHMQSGSFNYDLVDEKHRARLREAASRIRATHVLAAIDIGRELLAVKRLMPHGCFGAWLKAELDLPERTAQRLMQLADEFGDKSDTVSHLTLKCLYLLAAKSTPATVRDEVLARTAAGERLRAADVAALISAAKQPHRESEDQLGEPDQKSSQEGSDAATAATLAGQPEESGEGQSAQAAKKAQHPHEGGNDSKGEVCARRLGDEALKLELPPDKQASGSSVAERLSGSGGELLTLRLPGFLVPRYHTSRSHGLVKFIVDFPEGQEFPRVRRVEVVTVDDWVATTDNLAVRVVPKAASPTAGAPTLAGLGFTAPGSAAVPPDAPQSNTSNAPDQPHTPRTNTET